jgi:hypothetical protein
MEENLKKMRCGACGNNESFTVFKNTVTKYLIIECNECY